MTWKEYDGVPIALFQPGDIFGELEVYKNSKRIFSVMSISKMEVLVLSKSDFKKIFFRKAPFLGNRFVFELERKFLFLERVMQMIVDCVFHGKNIFEVQESVIGFERKGSLLKIEDRKQHLENFLSSYNSNEYKSIIFHWKLLIVLDLKINKEIFNNPRSPIKQFFDQIHEDFNQSEVISRFSRNSRKGKLSISSKGSNRKISKTLSKERTLSKFRKIQLDGIKNNIILEKKLSLSEKNETESKEMTFSSKSHCSLPMNTQLRKKITKCWSFSPLIKDDYFQFQKKKSKKRLSKESKVEIKIHRKSTSKNKKIEYPKRRSTLRNTDLYKFTRKFSKVNQKPKKKTFMQKTVSAELEEKKNISAQEIIKKYKKENKELKEKQLMMEYEKQLLGHKIKMINDLLGQFM